ncbi:DNA polymerase alpha, subunit B like protein, partial [Aduncisulcus paluster]
ISTIPKKSEVAKDEEKTTEFIKVKKEMRKEEEEESESESEKDMLIYDASHWKFEGFKRASRVLIKEKPDIIIVNGPFIPATLPPAVLLSLLSSSEGIDEEVTPLKVFINFVASDVANLSRILPRSRIILTGWENDLTVTPSPFPVPVTVSLKLLTPHSVTPPLFPLEGNRNVLCLPSPCSLRVAGMVIAVPGVDIIAHSHSMDADYVRKNIMDLVKQVSRNKRALERSKRAEGAMLTVIDKNERKLELSEKDLNRARLQFLCRFRDLVLHQRSLFPLFPAPLSLGVDLKSALAHTHTGTGKWVRSTILSMPQRVSQELDAQLGPNEFAEDTILGSSKRGMARKSHSGIIKMELGSVKVKTEDDRVGKDELDDDEDSDKDGSHKIIKRLEPYPLLFEELEIPDVIVFNSTSSVCSGVLCQGFSVAMCPSPCIIEDSGEDVYGEVCVCSIGNRDTGKSVCDDAKDNSDEGISGGASCSSSSSCNDGLCLEVDPVNNPDVYECVCFPTSTGANCSKSVCDPSDLEGACGYSSEDDGILAGHCVINASGSQVCECSEEGYFFNSDTGGCYNDCTPECGHGVCLSGNECLCDDFFTMDDDNRCTVLDCGSTCTTHGTCLFLEDLSDVECVCDSGWEGTSCGSQTCVNDCVHGECILESTYKCDCENSYWTGDACDELQCPDCGFAANGCALVDDTR